jgi:hypothetical protein
LRSSVRIDFPHGVLGVATRLQVGDGKNLGRNCEHEGRKARGKNVDSKLIPSWIGNPKRGPAEGSGHLHVHKWCIRGRSICPQTLSTLYCCAWQPRVIHHNLALFLPKRKSLPLLLLQNKGIAWYLVYLQLWWLVFSRPKGNALSGYGRDGWCCGCVVGGDAG